MGHHTDRSSSSSSGIGFCGLLAIVFITLKLLGKITWSWLWVLSPIWIPLAAMLAIVVFAGIVYGICHLIDKR